MLQEIRDVRQIAGEPKRRWFFCHEMDLVLWEEENGAICGFQLAYDKHKNEHALTWHQDRGFVHYVVDDGEPTANVNATPLLYSTDAFDRERVLRQFLALSGEIPPEISRFVQARLHEFDGPPAP